jgi:hypothetical protein
MAITQISRLQHRRGLRIDLPLALNDAEFGWADDTRELFIGNGPLAPIGGNTQILTALTPATVPEYTYRSNTALTAVTGFERSPLDAFVPSANFPIIRSYQDKFDELVSVLDYGATADGSDSTGAIRRANFDLYDETTLPITDLQKFRVLYFPAGTYVISKELYLYPNSVWVGDGPGRTKILLANGGTLAGDDDCVARTVDSLGQVGVAIDGTALSDPGNLFVSGITFETQTISTGLSLGQVDVIKLEDAKDVRFDDCDFVGTWTSGAVFSRAIHIGNPGSITGPFGGYTFSNCLFSQNAYGFRPTATTRDVCVLNSKFDTNQTSVWLGDNITLIVSLFRVTQSVFENVADVGFDVQTTGTGNVSTYNHYRGSGGTDYAIASVRFSGLTDFTNPAFTSTGNISLGDTFDRLTAYTCADKLTTKRVQNRSLTNIVMNEQDLFQIPLGFCGDIRLDGNLTISGTITTDNAHVTVSGVSPVLVLSYITGTTQAIFCDYAMEITAGTVYRIGTLSVVHDGSGGGGGITFSETFTEVGGPPSTPVALQALYAGGNTIELTVVGGPAQALTPSYKFLTRTIDIVI